MIGIRTAAALALFTGGLLAMAQTAQAQARAGARETAAGARAASGGELRIRRLDGLGKHAYIKSPEYNVQTSIQKGAKPAQNWVQILVDYDTEDEWIDELTVQFHALALTVEKGQKQYSMYHLTVRYGDIERGRGHMATAFLRPQAVKRYGDLIAVAVEISRDGKVIAEQNETAASAKLSESTKWWTVSKDVVVRAGYLLDKGQSPFALINIDDYEVIK